MFSFEWQASLAVFLPYAGSLFFSYFENKRQDIPNWYDKLKLPKWRPPNWMFPLVWSVLYGMMGWSSYLIWRDGGGLQGKAKWPLILYFTNLLLST